MNHAQRQPGFRRRHAVGAIPAFAQGKYAQRRAAVAFFFMIGKTGFAYGAAIGFFLKELIARTNKQRSDRPYP